MGKIIITMAMKYLLSVGRVSCIIYFRMFTFCFPFLFPVFDCNFESHCDLEYSPPMKEGHNRSWHRVSADEFSRLHLLDGPERDYSENSAEGENNNLYSLNTMVEVLLLQEE